ncbi:MAG: alkaline phosphatase family protein [Terriglobales bacterium]|jgi:phospholipase C
MTQHRKKNISAVLLFGLALTALVMFYPTDALAQFEHIVIIVQENRTPDNLFASCDIRGADAIKPSGGTTLLQSSIKPKHTHPIYLSQFAGQWTTSEKKYVSDPLIAPYCTLGAKYGFANRMFQTNQGPSLAAHQFVFGGTSIPGSTEKAPYDDWFVSEDSQGGCMSGDVYQVKIINPQTGSENMGVMPCFERGTLTDLLEAKGLTWSYYAASGGALWDAPLAIQHICGTVRNGECTGSEMQNVKTPSPQVLTDIANGNLANVSWVTPASTYSDHPTFGNGGPAWVSSIVNAIGQSAYWKNTAILITWDDWGGWYDHVAPLTNKTGWCTNYCYGFRVPMLVISARTPPMADNDNHDFGSILRFVEANFDLSLIGPGTYADAYADDLSEFFQGAPREFTKIRANHDAKYFLTSNDRGDPDDY